MSKLRIAILLVLASVGGGTIQSFFDHAAILSAQRAEAQANGLEDECKATLSADKWNLHGALTLLPNGGFKLEHVPMPACPDGLKRTIDAPEKDEVDALTVNCGVNQ